MHRTALAAAAAALVATAPAHAIDIDAGDYTALPAGTRLGIAYAQFAKRAALYSGGDRVPINAGLDSTIGILRGVYFTEIGGITIDPQFLLPFGKLEAKDDLEPALGDASGAADLILAATAWLINDAKAGTYFGITPFIYAPTGKYDRNSALNLGENRWKFALQLGYITPLSSSVTLDLAADATLYGKNDDFGPASQTLKQKPLYQAQAWLRYHLSPTLDLRLGLSQVSGGETGIDGVDQDNRLSTSKLALGAGWFVAPTTQLLATWGRDLSVREGLKENNRINLRLLQIF